MDDEFIFGQRISNYVQNRSTSKQMYTFSKAKRFPTPPSNAPQMYNFPSMLSTRSTSFGYGIKYDITTLNNNKERLKIRVPYYTIPKDKLSHHSSSPKYTFGLSREAFSKVVIENQLSMPNILSPGPAVYDTRNKPGHDGPSYSFGEKIIFKGKGYRLNIPGPGKYDSSSIEINKQGKYPISTYSNTKQVNWSKAKEERFFSPKSTRTPGPGKYNIHGLVNGSGKCYNSKFRSGTAKTFGKKLKGVFELNINGDTPGPGTYSTFSEFGFVRYGYDKNQTRNRSLKTEYGNFGYRPQLSNRSSMKSARTIFKRTINNS